MNGRDYPEETDDYLREIDEDARRLSDDREYEEMLDRRWQDRLDEEDTVPGVRP